MPRTLRGRYGWNGRSGLGRQVSVRLVRGVLLVPAGLLTAMVLLAMAGAARDDVAINARTGHATAEVLAVTTTRTVVQFAIADGQPFRPVEGLAYPSGLQAGQLVRVEYDRADPEVVRGSTWMIGLLPAAVVLLVLWALVLPTAWWLGRSRLGSYFAPDIIRLKWRDL